MGSRPGGLFGGAFRGRATQPPTNTEGVAARRRSVSGSYAPGGADYTNRLTRRLASWATLFRPFGAALGGVAGP
jgi:hypothetical protein